MDSAQHADDVRQLREALEAVCFFSRFYLTRNNAVIPAKMDRAWTEAQRVLSLTCPCGDAPHSDGPELDPPPTIPEVRRAAERLLRERHIDGWECPHGFTQPGICMLCGGEEEGP